MVSTIYYGPRIESQQGVTSMPQGQAILIWEDTFSMDGFKQERAKFRPKRQ